MADDVARELLGLIDTRAQDHGNASIAQNKTNVSAQSREAYQRTLDLPVDDGFAPAKPAAPTLVAQARGLRISWPTPPAADYVERTEVSRTNTSTGVETLSITDSTVLTIAGLQVDTLYSVKIRHIDAFNRTGDWSDPATATALHTKAEEIELSTAGSIVAGGSIEAGGATMDEDGLHLVSAFGSGTGTMRPYNNAVDWLTGPLGTNHAGPPAADERFAGIAFFSYLSGDVRRGMILQADGVFSNTLSGYDQKGQIIVRATDGRGTTPGTALETGQIYVNAGAEPGERGEILLDGNVWVEHDFRMFAPSYAQFDDMTITGYFNATGGVDFTTADYIDFTGVRIQGGYDTDTGNIGGSWSAQTPNVTLRRIANFVIMSGRVTNSSGNPNGPGSVIMTIPANFRPQRQKYLVLPQTTAGVYTGQARVRIDNVGAGGNIEVAPAGGGTANDVGAGQSLSFDGVVYALD